MTNMQEVMASTKKASRKIRLLSTDVKNGVLRDFADRLEENADEITAQNRLDLADAAANGMAENMMDRLLVTEERIHQIAEGVRAVADLADPIGRVLREDTLKSGIHLRKVSVPFGVIAVIFEARPNVAADCAALCLKSGNACLLKGGREAYNTNKAITACMKDVLAAHHIDPDGLNLLPPISHEESRELMTARQYIDLLIPRGSKRLIRSVIENASVPVIETGAGVCHVYVDESADTEMAEKIVLNAKCSRPSVCNAMETLLVHENIADAFLPHMLGLLKERGVLVHGDQKTAEYDAAVLPAEEENWYTEYNALEMNCRVVRNIEEACDHIEKYGTHHSDCIVTDSQEHADYFMASVDSACVYHNASTRFTDGFEFGLGAEIGISTQKLHARGPMGLNELTTYTYYLEGEGEIR